MKIYAFITSFIFIFIVFGSLQNAWGQINPNQNIGPDGRPLDPFKTDSTQHKSKEDWDETPAKIYYNYKDRAQKNYIDTSILFFNRNYAENSRNFNNIVGLVGPAFDLFYNPKQFAGNSLGYTAQNIYKFTPDSIRYYNTTRPFTSLKFMLGSKLMQTVDFVHTQNVTETWNFGLRIKNTQNQGFYNRQKGSSVNGSISSNYKSKNNRLNGYFAFIFNNFKQDENGGIVSDSFLTNPEFNNRELIPVFNPYTNSSTKRSSVNDRNSDMHFLFKNEYGWGEKIAHYNSDSSQVSYTFKPRFKIGYQLQFHNETHEYLDSRPDSNRYLVFGNFNFGVRDSIQTKQVWRYLDNQFSLNGIIGKETNPLNVTVGIANKIDWFRTDYETDKKSASYMNNYLFGSLTKEVLDTGQWFYNASAQVYLTGKAAGNLVLTANFGKDFKNIGLFNLGAVQSINNAAFTYNDYQTNFYHITNDFDKTSITQLYARLYITPAKFEAGIKNYLVTNNIYLDDQLHYQQNSSAENVLQVYGKKLFKFGLFTLDNEISFQQVADSASIRLPKFMFRHQLAMQLPIFKDKLDAMIGIDVRYNTGYYANGYSGFLNQFYVQNTQKITTLPLTSLFFNFKVKRLRVFVAGDQLQQLVEKKNNLVGPYYPMESAYFRFGFTWFMMN